MIATGREHTEQWRFDMQGQDCNGGAGSVAWPFCEPFSTTWERELRAHLGDGRWLPYAVLVGFWDARTLRRPQR